MRDRKNFGFLKLFIEEKTDHPRLSLNIKIVGFDSFVSKLLNIKPGEIPFIFLNDLVIQKQFHQISLLFRCMKI